MAQHESEQCQALTVMTEWKKRNKRGQRCPYTAKFVIGDKRLCLRHAWLEALATLLISGKARMLPRPPRLPHSPVPTVKDKS